MNSEDNDNINQQCNLPPATFEILTYCSPLKLIRVTILFAHSPETVRAKLENIPAS